MTESPEPAPDPSRISVVVPTYNDAGRLGDALDSIVAQTVRPGEIVVSDDGSEDATEALVHELAARHERLLAIRYVRLEARSGVVAARNEGIARSRGEWIACCDSDDMWAPEKLERQVEFLSNWRGRRRLALLGTYGLNMNDAKRVVSPAAMGPTSEEDYDELVRTAGIFYVIHSSALFSRADYLAVGGYTTEYGAADDFHFFCEMADRGVVLNLAEPLVFYRKRAGSVQLARFRDKQEGLMRLAENRRRRLAGRPPVGREEFAAQLASAPARERIRRRKLALGMYYYRAGAAHAVNGRRLQGAAELALASVMDGARLRAGIRNALRARLSQG